MKQRNKKIELLSPAGDLEKLKFAVLYGADAVYIGGLALGLRAKAKNFTEEQMSEGIHFAHDHGAKVYVTANILACNGDLTGAGNYFRGLYAKGADGVIISDPGLFSLAREYAPDLDIHISTQASVTNYQAVLFWERLGAKRVVMAREVTLEEIKAIREKTTMELEAFVHGAMCISYSGRCLLSSYMANRSGNKGECAQPCRWNYSLVEEQRPGEYYPVYEDEHGTYIMNSRDLCMIEHIPALVASGATSFKIEGRMKTGYYAAVVTRAYREALDDYMADPALYEGKKPYYLSQVSMASHRKFTTGFYFGSPAGEGQIYESSSYERDSDFIGVVLDYDKEKAMALVEQKNKFSLGEKTEFFLKDSAPFSQVLDYMADENGSAIAEAPHPCQRVWIKTDRPVSPMDILRRSI